MRSKSGDGKLTLLHIDDSADDRALVREAITLSETPFEYHEADGYDAALPYFQFHEPHGHPRPAMVLLDYQMGGHSGLDFLYWLRLMKKITSIPVVMFSGSPGAGHVGESYAAGANYFISKTGDLAHLTAIVRALHLSVVSPKKPGPILLLQEYQPDPRERPGKPKPA